MAQRVCVTGACGKAGRAVVRDLREHGYDVVPTDIAVTRRDLEDGTIRADLTDYGQTVEVLHTPDENWGPEPRRVDAVVHLANIPAPGIATPALTFTTNMTMNANVFLAAARLGVRRVVWASSETTLGLPFDVPPRYAPIDEQHYPHPTTTYALSKVASETTAAQIAQWSGIPFVALRFSNIMSPEDYQRFPSAWDDATTRRWNLWGYIDERDVALSCRLALTAAEDAVAGSPSFIIAAADTVMNRPSAELLAEVFPDVPLTRDVGEFGTLLSIDHAREVLGFQPQHSWRDHVGGEPA
jgi:nucleoside-diphosphate-sugar epimerase